MKVNKVKLVLCSLPSEDTRAPMTFAEDPLYESNTVSHLAAAKMDKNKFFKLSHVSVGHKEYRS